MRSICTHFNLPEAAVGVAFFGEPESVTSYKEQRQVHTRFTIISEQTKERRMMQALQDLIRLL